MLSVRTTLNLIPDSEDVDALNPVIVNDIFAVCPLFPFQYSDGFLITTSYHFPPIYNEPFKAYGRPKYDVLYFRLAVIAALILTEFAVRPVAFKVTV